MPSKKKAIEEARDGLKPGDVFYYADEFNVSWLQTLRAMWSRRGQQVMILPSHQLAVVRLGHYKGSQAAGGATRRAVGLLVEAVQPMQ